LDRILCKSKIHRATVKNAELMYEGSLTIDEELMSAANIMPYEMVQVANVTNGQRFETYAITGSRGSGEICLNGAAARLGAVGDEIIIMSYGLFTEEELKTFEPKIIFVDKENRMIKK
jgi:aspartate 1-decarboxylase